jgi:pimeloyl-ACP methyl ester carboxylesterase
MVTVMNTQKSNQQEGGDSNSAKASKAIVLVHGGFVDGSGWAGVYRILKKKGYAISIVQNPTKSLADDVAVTKSAIDNLDRKVVLVGHSYGGVVITESGEPETASFMADSQVPRGVDALSGAVSEPAWKTKPSYYLVASDDKMIPPPAQRAMAGRINAEVMEVPGSHSVYVSKPAEVAEIIERAATSFH